MQSNPRILANLPVILVKTLVNLPVKLTKLGQLVDSTSLWVPWGPWATVLWTRVPCGLAPGAKVHGSGTRAPDQCTEPGAMGTNPKGYPAGGGRYALERLLLGGVIIPYPVPIGYVLPDGPPDARGPLEVLVGIVLGELDSSTPRVSG